MISKLKRGVLNVIRRVRRRSMKHLPRSAFHHNSLSNVNQLNQQYAYWLKNLENDSKFIDKTYKDIIRLCRIDQHQRVADYGCGTGVLVHKLRMNFPDLSVVGFDFSESKVTHCRQYYGLDFFACRSVYDPIHEQYDVIIATEVLEHLEYPMRAVRNLLSALTPGGRLLLTVPDGRTDTYYGHIHFWSPESWVLFLREAVDLQGSFTTGELSGKNYALVIRSKEGVI